MFNFQFILLIAQVLEGVIPKSLILEPLREKDIRKERNKSISFFCMYFYLY